MKHKEGNPPYIYICLHLKIRARIKGNPYIKTSELRKILGRQLYFLPKSLHFPVLSQMEEHGFIKRINRQKYRVLPPKHNSLLQKLRNYEFW